jgi:hypothetical protein
MLVRQRAAGDGLIVGAVRRSEIAVCVIDITRRKPLVTNADRGGELRAVAVDEMAADAG